MVATLFNTGLLIKPARAISQLSIDTDKSWEKTFPITPPSPAWATSYAAFKKRKKFTLYGTTRAAWWNASWAYRKEWNARGPESDVCTGGTASASSYFGVGYEPDKAFDDNFTATKWATPSGSAVPSWIKYDLGVGITKTVTAYTVTSGNDGPSRDPRDWTFEGSNDNVLWTVLDTQKGQSFSSRLQTRIFRFANVTAYRYYRLNITANSGSDLTQIEELEFCEDLAIMADYQIWHAVSRTRALDTAGIAYIGTDCLANYNDLRFIDQDGNELPYWIEGTDATTAYVWVKVPRAPCRYYMYYGNAAAPAGSTDSAMILADNFERGVNGDPVGGIWQVTSGTATISTDHAFSGTRCMKLAGGGGGTAVQTPLLHSDDIAINYRLWKETAVTNGPWGYLGDGLHFVQWYADGAENVYYWSAGAGHDTGKNLTPDAWEGIIIFGMKFDTTFKYTMNVNAGNCGVMDMDAGNWYIDFLGLQIRDAVVGRDIYIDNVFVRKYTGNAAGEPGASIPMPREIQALPTTNYPLKIVLQWGGGTDVGDVMFLDSQAAADFRDIRFADSSGNPLHYHIDYYSMASYVVVNVLFPTVPGLNATSDMYVYYSNDSAISESNLYNTFPLFADGPATGTLDAAKWLGLSGVWNVSSVTDKYSVARYAIRQTDVTAAQRALQTVPNILGDNVAIECWSYNNVIAAYHGPALRCADNNNYYAGQHGGFAHQVSLWKRVAAVNTELAFLAGTRDTLWHHHSLKVNGTRLSYSQDDSSDVVGDRAAVYVAEDAALSSANLKLALGATGAAAATQWFTDVRVRPYYYQEPIIANWGAVEAEHTYYGVTTVKDLAADDMSTWAAGLSAWTQRTMFTMFGSTAGAVTPYQVKVRVYKNGTGGILGNVYLSGLCNDDFSDIRFTDSLGAALPHWRATYVNGVWADFWVRLPTLPIFPGNAQFFLYYGNVLAVTASDPASTWLMYFDGSSVAGWTLYNGVGGGANVSVAIVGGKIRMTGLNNLAAGHLLCDTPTGTNNYKLGAYIVAQDGLTANNFQQGLVTKVLANNNDNSEARWIDNPNAFYVSDEAGFTASGAWTAYDARNEHELVIGRYGDGSIGVMFADGAPVVQRISAAWLPQIVGLHTYFEIIAHWADFAKIFVGNFIYPEPTWGAWVASQMHKGDMLVHDGTRLSIVSPGPVGTNLMANDPGNLPAWGYPP